MNIGGLGIGGLNMRGFKIPSFNYVAPTVDQEAINKALEAVTVRKEANDAISNATDQYEADVADFKNTQATEIEQGIATLPEILNLSETPFVPEGIGSFTSLPRTEREIGRENELPYQETIIPRMPNEDFIPFVPPQIDEITKRDEQIFVPPPSIQDLDERDFRDTIGDDFLPTPDIIPATDPVINLPSDDFLTGGEPSINLPVFKGEGGREDFVRDFDDTGFGDYIIEDPIIPPMTPPVDVPIDLPIDNPYIGIFKPPINIPGIFDDIGYPPFDEIDYPPFDPPYIPPITDPDPDPDPDPIIPPPPPPSGPINYYTGQPINNPYTPYSTDSGAAPLTRTMNPREFGRAPGMFTPGGPPAPPPIIRKPPPRKPPRDDIIFPPPPDDFPEELRPIAMSPAGANSGGYLNNGISMLPMNGQGDTLTTQVFQSGFRPRR